MGGNGGGCGARRRTGGVEGGDGRVGVKQWGEAERGGNGRPVMHIMERCCAVDVRCKDKLVQTGWREWDGVEEDDIGTRERVRIYVHVQMWGGGI